MPKPINKTQWNPAYSLLQTLRYVLTGRIHFPRERVGETLTMPDGHIFIIFRQVVIDPAEDSSASPGALFQVRFHLAGMSARQNQRFSLLPIPFFVGLPGFRAKLWMLDETRGDFQGLYRWDSVAAAERYANSYAMRFMTRRAVPGSVSHRIVAASDPEGFGDLADLRPDE